MRRLMIVFTLVVVVLGLTPAAWAAQRGEATEELVVLSGSAQVPRGGQVGDLVVFHGSATVDGTVNGSVTAFDAPVTISGRVSGDVVVFRGRVELRSGAEVTGDVVSQSAPVLGTGARVGGETRRVATHVDWQGFGWVGRLALWLAVSVSTLVLGLSLLWLVGPGAARIADAGRTAIGSSIGWGVLLFFGLPVLAIIALVTLVGIPLGLMILAALGLIYALGYTATAWIVGRRIVREPTTWVVAFLAGWAILRILALIPIVGGLVWLIAAVFGLGAVTVAHWKTRSRPAVPA